MHLYIEHETIFRFAEPATHSIQYLRLTPRRDPCQRLISWTLETPGSIRPWTDGFDNAAHVSVQDGQHDAVDVVVRGEVETIDTSGVLPLDDGLPPLIFLRATALTKPEGDVAELAAPYEEGMASDRLPTLHKLLNDVADRVTYEPGMTTAETTAAEALKHGKGVCQDQAHLFIAACRHLGVPARYVSGYLQAGVGNDSHVASHAWAEALVDQLGWVSFDPANRQSATDAYVRLAIGLDYQSAGPVRGLRQGGGIEELDVRVSVEDQTDGQ